MTALAPDLRDGATWTPAQRLKNDVLFIVARAALAAAGALPRSLLAPLGRAVGVLAHATLGRARRTALSNLARACPELPPAEREALGRRVFATLGEDLGDTLALLRPGERPERTLGVAEGSAAVLDRALAENRGVVYLTAHLGPWERMAALLAGLGYPITTLARESYDPRFDAWYDRLRARRGVEAIYRGRPSAPLSIVRALARGRVVGFPVDLPGRIPVVATTLLGVPSWMPVGPARIALRTRAPIVVGTPAPDPEDARRLVVRIEPLDASSLAADPEGEAELVGRMADALSARIRALPAHWPWMHPSFERPRTPPALRLPAPSRNR